MQHRRRLVAKAAPTDITRCKAGTSRYVPSAAAKCDDNSGIDCLLTVYQALGWVLYIHLILRFWGWSYYLKSAKAYRG